MSRQSPDYGVLASLDGDRIDLALTFHTGSAYCCYEAGCHLDLLNGKRWEWLRQDLSVLGVNLAPRFELRLVLVVEPGSLFFDFTQPEPSPRGRGWYAFAPEPARRFERVIREGEDPNAEPRVAPDCGGIK
jgi:hypothetical protein